MPHSRTNFKCLWLFGVLIAFSNYFHSAAIAQWPSEQGVGIPLVENFDSDEVVIQAVEAPDGTFRVLTRSYVDDGYHWVAFYLQLYAMDRNGNRLWDISDSERRINHREESADGLGQDRPRIFMKVGANGETWILWESYSGSQIDPEHPWYAGNNEIRINRFSSTGERLWQDGLRLANLSVFETFSSVHHLELLSEGSVIAVWRDVGAQSEPTPGVYAERFDSLGNSVWAQGRVRLMNEADTTAGRVNTICASDGSGGILLFEHLNLLRLRGNGEFAWPYGTIQSTRLSGNVFGYELEPGNIILVSSYSGLSSIVAYDSSGQLTHGESHELDYYIAYPSENVTFPMFLPWGEDGGFIFVSSPNFVAYLNSQLNTTTETRPAEVWPYDGGDLHTTVSPLGIRYSNLFTGNRVYAIEPPNDRAWSISVAQEDTTLSFFTYPLITRDGTTFVFWSRPNGNGHNRDVFVNVVDLDGNWGRLETEVTENQTITIPTASSIALTAWPNPSNASWVTQLTSSSDKYVELSLYNTLGQLLQTKHVLSSKTGVVKTYWSTEGLTTGTYFLRAATKQNQIVSHKLVLIK